MSASLQATSRSATPELAARIVGALLLLTSGIIHLYLAKNYQGVEVRSGTFSGSFLTQPFIFRAQGVVTIVLAIGLIAVPARFRNPVWFITAVTMLASVAAVLIYRYFQVGAIGPIPDMSDAQWSPTGKPLSAIVEGACFVLACVRISVSPRR